jgi:hypothetical protein
MKRYDISRTATASGLTHRSRAVQTSQATLSGVSTTAPNSVDVLEMGSWPLPLAEEDVVLSAVKLIRDWSGCNVSDLSSHRSGSHSYRLGQPLSAAAHGTRAAS